MKAYQIEPGMALVGAQGMTREVLAVDHEARPKTVTYRQTSLGNHSGSGCIPAGSTKTVNLVAFARWAETEITETMAPVDPWLNPAQRRAS